MSLFRRRDPPTPSPVMEAAVRLSRLSEDLRIAAQALTQSEPPAAWREPKPPEAP